MIRRSTTVAAKLIAAIVTPVLLLVVAGVVVLARGPISLGPFTDQLEAVLSEVDPRLNVKVADAIIAWDGETNRFEIRVVGARLSTPDGEPVATFSEMTVLLRARELLFGRVVPLGVEVIRPKLEVLRAADGRLYLRTGASDAVWPLEAVLEAFADRTAFDEEQPGDLLNVSARHADLTFEDQQSGLRVVAPDATLTAARGDEIATLSFSALMRIRGQPVSVGLGLVRRIGASHTEATLRFRGLEVASLPVITELPQLAPLAGAAVALSGIVDTSVGDAGELSYVDFDIALSPGVIDLADYLRQPLHLASGNVRGRLAGNLGDLSIKSADVQFSDGPKLHFGGTISGFGEALALTGGGSFADLRTDDLDVYWPLPLAPNARRWVTQNVADGVIPEGSLTVDIRPGDLAGGPPRDEMVRLDFRFEGVSSSYFRDMPRLREGRGTGRIIGRTFSLDVPSARVLDLDVTKGRLFVPDVLAEPPVLQATFVATGAVASALRLIDHPPLGFATDMGIDPGGSEGWASTRTELTIPLKKALKLSDVNVGAQSTLRGYASPAGFAGKAVSDGNLKLQVDKSGLVADGTLALDGAPIELTWRRGFGAASDGDRLRIHATLDEAGRAALGLTLDGHVAGPVPTDARLVIARGGAMTGQAELDLTAASVALPEIYWSKPAGTPARLKLDLSVKPGEATTLRQIDLSGDDVRFDGDLDLGRAQQLDRLVIRALRFGRTDLAGTVQRRPDDTFDVRVSGNSLDLAPYLAADDDGGEGDPALDLAARFGTVWLGDDIRITDVSAVGSLRQGAWQTAQARGAVNGGPAAWLSIGAQETGRRLELVSGDAGAVLRTLDLADGIQGGRMRVDAILPPAGSEAPTRGLLRADDFQVTNAPILAQVLTLGSLTGIVDLLQGEGIAFSRLEIPFTLDGDLVSVKEARAVGPALGLTADMEHNRASGALSAEGTVVPAYTLNSALGHLPFIGKFLVGGQGAGIFAMTYRIAGNVENPEVTVNPLTALAPGFLRNIVTGLDKPAVPPEDIPLLQQLERLRDLK